MGRVLGICFTVCFMTGLLSHYQYQPWTWLPEPAHPIWGYRLTQGLHVTTGIATIPLLLVKLWAVYPKLFAWPPAKSLAEGVERLTIAVFVSAALVELFTGFFNVLDWYPWPWDFVMVHRFLAYVVFGSLLLHIAVKLPIIKEGLATPLGTRANAQPSGLSRRGLLVASAAGTGIVVVTTAGQTFSPLRPLDVLAPRRADSAPQHVPINKTADQAGVRGIALSSSWRLTVVGPRSFDLDLAAVEALAPVQHHLPLACVEGWSVSAHWQGPLLIDLVRRAGGDEGSRVLVTSLEQYGSYRTSYLEGPQVASAILATHLNGVRLTLDHGYPLRLIAPDRAGVLNTKWLTEIEVL
ncbi:molybdopterin-dependent oxidoreductase [Jatrophihabitans sp.]|uniref:molybdopterin-dependent oxidoreductase n=1 Tax=Jatrophihabitans sp. TaxID=1932789 RepID=UPI0030C722E4|nr:hypothetical protein [Jatrophihabitans sp.]